MSDNHNLIELKGLISKIFGVADITLDTCINELNTVSEDNDSFITQFQNKFGVDMANFPYYDYFEEDEFILWSLIKRFFPKRKRKKLTVQHLLEVIKEGKWIDVSP